MLSLRHHLDPNQDVLSHVPSQPPFFTNTTQSRNHSYRSFDNIQQQRNTLAYSQNIESVNNPFMSPTYNYSGPAIRVQQSTPQPPVGYTQEQGFPTYTSNWLGGSANGQNLSVGSQPSVFGHQRTKSGSSNGSNSPASTYRSATAMRNGTGPAIPKIDSSVYNVADESSRTHPNHLPTPTQTPTQEAFLASSAPSYPQINNIDSTMNASMAMKQALDGNFGEEDAPGFSHSTRHSVSSFGRNSPATPRTVNGEDFEEGFMRPSNDLAVRPMQQVPKFERTLTDAYADELYNPASMPTSTPQTQNYQTMLSPYRNVMMSERLQQANQARSQSPTAAGSRGVSPFRQGSPYAATPSSFASPQSRLSAGAQLRQKQKSDAEAAAMSRHQASDQDIEPKTISPKDAVLDYHASEEDSNSPLFSDTDNTYDNYPNSYSQAMPSKADNSYGSLAAGGVNSWNNPSGSNTIAAYSAASTSTPSQAQFNFAPSSVPGMFHGLPTSTYGSSSMVASTEETPEFPAHLTSMESSASEAPPQSSQNSVGIEPTRPTSTLADSGTYTCTYHGCTQRFETPQKLQRHKREAHRQSNTSGSVQPASRSTPPTQGIGSGMTSAALAARNSQAGPHKCERINPTTGKPCNTIFSRPYDLTRHEDTIHNVRKQKVRCALCQEEKTFSRNDALTRHMRVVHPDVDFPGKHRKRGGRSDD